MEAELNRVELTVELEALDRPDLVPVHIAASVVHDFTGSPSISTTQAPQLEVSHPQCVPVSPAVSRMKWTSSVRDSTSRLTVSPLIVIESSSRLRPPDVARGRSPVAKRVS